MTLTIGELLPLLGVPSAITGLAVWLLKKWLEKKEKKAEEKEQSRTDMLLSMVASINGSIALAEATAKAVARIPDAHCNGDMHAALDYVQKVKNAQKDLLFRAGIRSINDN